MRTIAVESDEHWRELRQEHVGGSEVAALFGEHPQLTKFELWHRKKGNIPEPNFSDNPRVFWGTVLEPAIAQGVSAKTGWQVRKVRRYISCRPQVGLGCTLDYEIVANDRGPGVLEIKTADWLVAKQWDDGEPPLSYELQLQSYFAGTGRNWGCMAVLVGGNELRLFEYERRPKTIATIEAEIAEFWRSVEAGEPPVPNFERDGKTIGQIYGSATAGKVIDLSDNNRLPTLITEYQHSAAEEGANKRCRERVRAEILMLVGDAETVLCGGWRLNIGSVAPIPDRIIDQGMVGGVIKGRSGYRQMKISARKEATAA